MLLIATELFLSYQGPLDFHANSQDASLKDTLAQGGHARSKDPAMPWGRSLPAGRVQRGRRWAWGLVLISCMLGAPMMLHGKTPAKVPPKPSQKLFLEIPTPAAIGKTAKTISLQQALIESARRNLTLAQAKTLISIARGRHHTQAQRWIPSLQVGVQGLLQGGHVQGNFGDENILNSPLYQVFPWVQLSHTFHPARIVLGRKRTQQDIHVAQHRVTRTKDTVLIMTASAYLRMLRAQVRLHIIDRGILQLQSLLKIAEARLQSVGNRAEVLLLQVQMAQERQQRKAVNSQLRLTSAALAQMLGRSPSSPLYAVSGTLRPHQLAAWKMAPKALLRQVLHRHPLIRQTKAQIKALSHQHSALVLGTWLPAIGFQLHGRIFEAGVLNQNNGMVNVGPQYYVGASLQWDLQATTLGKAEVVLARREARRRALRRLQLQLRTLCVKAYQRTKFALARLKPARRAVALSRESLQLNQTRYRNGIGTAIETLQAQQALLKAQVSWLDAIIAHNHAQVLLQGTLGQLQPQQLVP